MDASKEKRERLQGVCIRGKLKLMNSLEGRLIKMRLEIGSLFWKEVSKVNEGKVETCSRIKIELRDWYWERMKSEGIGRSILRIIICMPKRTLFPNLWF